MAPTVKIPPKSGNGAKCKNGAKVRNSANTTKLQEKCAKNENYEITIVKVGT
jgi:hypothetical protein